MQTGRWPDKTVFVLEFRNSGSGASINKAGRFQTDLAFIEVEVKTRDFRTAARSSTSGRRAR